jgi:hypothetical protein
LQKQQLSHHIRRCVARLRQKTTRKCDTR